MTSSIDSMIKRASAALVKVAPRQLQPVMHLPIVYLDPACYQHGDPNSYKDHPGCESHNVEALHLAEALGIQPGVLVMGPDEDGTEE